MARTRKTADAAQMVDDRGLITMSNVQALNTVRRYAPNDYQQRIPIATQGNLESVLRAMNAYQPNWDVYWNVFVGRIGRVSINERLRFENPLAKMKQPALTYGRSMQEIQANLIKAKRYDPRDINVFGREGREPEIFQAFHQESRRDKYELNIPMEDVLHGSFIEGQSIATFFNSLTALPVQSAANDEYLLMRQLFSAYDAIEGYYNLHVDSPLEEGIAFEEQQQRGAQLIRKMRAQYKKLKFNSAKYSPAGREAGLTQNTKRVFVVMDADTEAVLQTITTAYAYHDDNQDIFADEIIILDELPVQGACALMLDEDWFQCADTLGPLMLTAPLNPVNMSINYFFHIWQIMSYSRFLGAVMFSTRADTEITAAQSTVTGVVLKDAEGQTGSTVELRGTVRLFATVEGTNNPSQAVAYEIKAFDGKGCGMTLPAECYVDSEGVFHAGNAKAVDKFVISATSIQNGSFSADYTVQIAGATYASAISAQGISVEQGQTGKVKVSVTPANATDAGFEVYSLYDEIGIGNIDSTGFEVTAGLDSSVGVHDVLVVATGGDPAQARVQQIVHITITAKA